MTELNEFLLKPEVSNYTNREFIIPRFGEKHPITLKVITSSEYQTAMQNSIKWGKDHKNEGRDGNLFLENVCLMGIINPVLTDNESIEKADEMVSKTNAESIKQMEEIYAEELKKWEKESGDEKTKPKKRKAATRGRISTPKDLLELWFFPGEIASIADKILEMSGFGVTLEEAVNKSKN